MGGQRLSLATCGRSASGPDGRVRYGGHNTACASGYRDLRLDLDYNDIQLAGRPMMSNIYRDGEFVRQNIFGGIVNARTRHMMSYAEQILTLAFPLSVFYSGSHLLIRGIKPFRAGHVVTLRGEGMAAQARGDHCQDGCTRTAPINWTRSYAWPRLP